MGKIEANRRFLADRIDGERIVINGQGQFPKKVIIIEADGKRREYELKKTRKGNYLLN